MQTYTDEMKAQVIADYALGLSKSAIAKKHNVSRTTVITWLANHERPVPTVSDAFQRDHLGQLVYDYLVTGFEALIAQHRIAADPEYLKGEGVALAEIYKALHGGVVSVAQAIERGQPVEPD